MFCRIFRWLPFFVGIALAASAPQWRSRSIYQILTDRFARSDGSTTAPCDLGFQGFCGGTWSGITQKLDYIQGMGFDAIWISTVVEQVSNPARAYHGYCAKNIYALNGNFGSAEDLKGLAKALHDRNMFLMLDVVANHMAFDGNARSIDYSSFNPFNNRSFFHDVCFITDWTNVTQIQQCWLGGEVDPLPDLNTTSPIVRDEWRTWVNSLVANYSIDGIRVDTAQNIEQSFFPSFGKAAGRYPAYYTSVWFFNNTRATSGNIVYDFYNTSIFCKDTSLVGEFMENHDKPRFASYTDDMSLVKNNVAYVMLKDGIPIIYQGQEQHYKGGDDPFNREAIWFSGYNTDAELYKFTKQMNAIRKMAINKASFSVTPFLTSMAKVVYYDAHNVAFAKGPPDAMILTMINNNGAHAANYTLQVATSRFTPRTPVVELLTCTQMMVGSQGSLTLTVTGGTPLVLYPYNLLQGTGWCGS
ncbi:glycoside hydrolase family 13 protein [Bimuria novae-zelandiae CBS 107.79]|uniref:alpha-amylase n=1 Tax=Bimuria novae-zelandiae CBS 107.79 TaxID=1447943 RepID=A0A6A5VPE9_9PLEO|nr:glycoside hydrolase family 13 protein [Bimuria novae-zelandiae CBS 107.79]